MKHTSSKRIGVSALTILLIFSFLFSLILPAFSAAAEEPEAFLGGNVPATAGTSVTPDMEPPKGDSASSERYRRRNEENGLNVKIYANADGTRTLEYYPTAVKYLTKRGTVRDILLRFSKDKEGGFVASAHYLDISLPEKLTEGITVGYPDMGIGIGMAPVTDTVSAAECSRDCETVSYTGENSIYEYRLTYDGLKEDIVVPAYSEETEYRFELSLEGLTPVPSEDSRNGSYHLVDEEGAVRGSIGDILVTTADEKNNTFGNLALSAEEDGTWLGIISVDADYLADERTVYPIRIDPNISIRYDENRSYTWDDIEDITVNQNHATDAPYSGTLYVGRAGMDYGAMRSVLRFPGLSLTGIPAANIISANLYVRDLMCYGYNLQVDCYEYDAALPTGSFTQSNMTWSGVYNAMLTYETSGRFHSTNYVCYNNGYAANHIYTFNILPAVKDWAQKQNAGNGFQNNQQAVAFKATNAYEASTNEHYVCFGSYDRAVNKPYLEIQYTEPVPDPDPVPTIFNGVYSIQNVGVSYEDDEDGYLSESDELYLGSYSINQRNQNWWIQPIQGTNYYSIMPLSRTTVACSGTQYALFFNEYEHEVIIENSIYGDSILDSHAKWVLEEIEGYFRICPAESENDVFLLYENNAIVPIEDQGDYEYA